MPQNPTGVLISKNAAGAFGSPQSDPQTGKMLLSATGGIASALNITAAAVIKATPGRLCKIAVSAPGATSGAFTLNDCATTGAAAASNQIWAMAYNAAANLEGAIFTLDWPCSVGIVVSTVPGGSPIIAISFV